MKEFKAAARAADGDEEEVLEFAIAGEEFVADIPSTAQIAMFVAAMTDEASTSESLAAVFRFLKDVLQGDGYQRLRRLISAGVIDLDMLTGGGDENDEGITDWIIGQASQSRPTPASSGSSASPAATGRPSTGRSPGRGSTRSASLSPVS